MQQIRITSTGKVREALNALRDSRYPLLSDAEIIKVTLSQAITGTVSGECFFIEKLDEEASKSLTKSRRQINNGEYQTADSASELMEKLKK